MMQSSFCQTDSTKYPKKMVFGSDTVVCITNNQLRSINLKFLRLDHLDSVMSLKDTQISSLQTKSLFDSLALSKCTFGLQDCDSVVANQKVIIDEQKSIIGSKDKSMKRLRNNNKGLKFIASSVGVVSLILLLIVVL